MNRSDRKANKTKDLYGGGIRRSEYDDGLLRNNNRAGNRLQTEMHYYERAQKVIMKDLGKESTILRNKFDNEQKVAPNFGLYGSKFGTTTNGSRKYASTSPMGKVLTSTSFQPTMRRTGSRTGNGLQTETRFPWDRDATDRDSSLERESGISNNTSPTLKSKTKYKTPTASAYPSARAQSDDFLASILNEAMQDELLYAQSPETKSAYTFKPEKTPRSRRHSKARKIASTPTESIVNSLANAQETEAVIY